MVRPEMNALFIASQTLSQSRLSPTIFPYMVSPATRGWRPPNATGCTDDGDPCLHASEHSGLFVMTAQTILPGQIAQAN